MIGLKSGFTLTQGRNGCPTCHYSAVSRGALAKPKVLGLSRDNHCRRIAMLDPFSPGNVVIVTLNMPREKFWGTIVAGPPAGASLRGIDLNSLDDFAADS